MGTVREFNNETNLPSDDLIERYGTFFVETAHIVGNDDTTFEQYYTKVLARNARIENKWFARDA